MARLLWACLRLPTLAIDATLRQHPPEWQQRPFALLHGPVQRRVLAAVNEPARRAGLHAGQSLAVAEAIYPQLANEALQLALLDDSRQLLAAWAWQYSSQVVVGHFSDALMLEVGASLALFGPWPRLADKLHRGLTDLGFRHRLVLAPNPQAAHALAARHDDLAITTLPELQRALQSLPVACAGFEASHAERLQRMGLKTLGRVLALPRGELARRFGTDFIARLQALQGHGNPSLPLWRPPVHFRRDIHFQRGVEASHALLFPLQRLTADLATFLRSRDGGVQHFELILQYEDHTPQRLAVGLLAPERDAGRLFELARQHLQRAHLPAPVTALGLAADKLPDFVPERGDLFSQRPGQQLTWPALRERLRARLGEDAVQHLAWRPDHRPEHAWQGCAEPGTDAETVPSRPRPTWLLARPIPLRGPAPRILAGPERIESGWWDGGDTRRDYYVVETAHGQRAWVFCAVGEQGPFQLHGWFA